MKQILIIAIVGFFVFSISSSTALSQVVVKVKPVPPRIKMMKPQKPDSDHILIPGHWIWHRPSKMYAWVSPSWVPENGSKVWISGHWKQMPKGWKWVPGHWQNKYKKRYFLK